MGGNGVAVNLMLSDQQVAAIVKVALGNPCRTEAEQRLLVEVTRAMDNVFCDWTGEAHETWTQEPCEVCGEPTDRAERVPVCEPCVLARPHLAGAR